MKTQEEISQIVAELKIQGYYGICFWLPVRSVGGGTLMFCQFAQRILEMTDLNVYYVDYTDGYAHSLFPKESKIQFITYTQKALTLPIQEPVIVVTSASRAAQIKALNPKSKILLWNWDTNPVSWKVLFFQGEEKNIL